MVPKSDPSPESALKSRRFRSGTVLAFDFGERRIGVAVGELQLGVAHPLETINAEANDVRFARIELRDVKRRRFVALLALHRRAFANLSVLDSVQWDSNNETSSVKVTFRR